MKDLKVFIYCRVLDEKAKDLDVYKRQVLGGQNNEYKSYYYGCGWDTYQ